MQTWPTRQSVQCSKSSKRARVTLKRGPTKGLMSFRLGFLTLFRVWFWLFSLWQKHVNFLQFFLLSLCLHVVFLNLLARLHSIDSRTLLLLQFVFHPLNIRDFSRFRGGFGFLSGHVCCLTVKVLFLVIWCKICAWENWVRLVFFLSIKSRITLVLYLRYTNY